MNDHTFPLKTLNEVLSAAEHGGYAVGSFAPRTTAMIHPILCAGQAARSPLIVDDLLAGARQHPRKRRLRATLRPRENGTVDQPAPRLRMARRMHPVTPADEQRELVIDGGTTAE